MGFLACAGRSKSEISLFNTGLVKDVG